MGLDQYLYAKRAFDPDSPDAEAVLSAAGKTAADLRTMADLDPFEHETGIYLDRWDPSKRAPADAIVNAADLMPFTTEHSCGGLLRWEDGKVAVEVTTIYWRKANAVHGWFVDNCQDGVDDCGTYPVDGEQLARLRSVCLDALAAYAEGDAEKAGEIMSPRAGFFFGGTDVDQWWVEDLRHTASEIDRVINLAASTPGRIDFAYHSSW
jgi:hypothetical protein